MHQDEQTVIKGWCPVCKDVTPHTFRSFTCITCRDKDLQDMQSAVDRFRLAEGLDQADYIDPDQGDIFDIGDADV